MSSTHTKSNSTYLITGGARSGKSSYAEKIAIESKQDVTYIATAQVYDDEMKQRVKQHINDRPSHWKTIEEPIELSRVIEESDSINKVILVDCLTMWVNNLLMQEDDALLKSEIGTFLDVIQNVSGNIILVSNEVGMGIIPMGELTRKFVDESGRLHQRLGQTVDNVLLMVAGLGVEVKGKKPF